MPTFAAISRIESLDRAKVRSSLSVTFRCAFGRGLVGAGRITPFCSRRSNRQRTALTFVPKRDAIWLGHSPLFRRAKILRSSLESLRRDAVGAEERIVSFLPVLPFSFNFGSRKPAASLARAASVWISRLS